MDFWGKFLSKIFIISPSTALVGQSYRCPCCFYSYSIKGKSRTSPSSLSTTFSTNNNKMHSHRFPRSSSSPIELHRALTIVQYAGSSDCLYTFVCIRSIYTCRPNPFKSDQRGFAYVLHCVAIPQHVQRQ